MAKSMYTFDGKGVNLNSGYHPRLATLTEEGRKIEGLGFQLAASDLLLDALQDVMGVLEALQEDGMEPMRYECEAMKKAYAAMEAATRTKF